MLVLSEYIIWSHCNTRNYFTRQEERNIVRQEDNVYVSKKRQVVGMFGMLLLMNAICFGPVLIVAALAIGFEMPPQVYATVVVCALFITVSNPLVQSFFRQDIKVTVINMFRYTRQLVELNSCHVWHSFLTYTIPNQQYLIVMWCYQ